jgi:nucleotide-binding universal stress UspA family protein
MNKRILVATRGTPTSDAALRVAAAIAARQGDRVEVVAVLEPLPILDAGFAPAIVPYDAFDQQRGEDLTERVKGQIAAVTGSSEMWPIQVRIGSPAGEIAKASRASDVVMVVLGVGRHSPADRIFGGETALKVSRTAPVPVYAVAPGRDKLPRRAVVGMDFSASSIEAARQAMRLLEAPAQLSLVHVSPALEIPPIALEEWQAMYARGVMEGFEKVKVKLAPPPGITVDTVTLSGEAAEEILRLATHLNADLIAAGSHGHNFIERVLIGSVATKLLRATPCSMLLVPTVLQLVQDEVEIERRAHAIPEPVF